VLTNGAWFDIPRIVRDVTPLSIGGSLQRRHFTSIVNTMSKSKATSDDATLQILYQELCSQSCSDRAAKVQLFCEHTWNHIERDPLPKESLVHGLVTLLQDDANLLLVRLVVPELRNNALSPTNPAQQKVLRQINPHRKSIESLWQRPQTRDPEAHRLYEEEKAILQDAELNRAAMLLYGHGPVGEVQKAELRQWLATYPADRQ
jgi:hypothetical protein